MPDLVVTPAHLAGTVCAPPSKSVAHRALICAALASGKSRVSPLSGSDDMHATIQVLSAMGAHFSGLSENGVSVDGGRFSNTPVVLDCLESGSTLRFLLPVAAVLGILATFTGHGRLPQRPMDALIDQLKAHGITFSSERMPFAISGVLSGGIYTLPGDVSSQFISGLLFALPLAEQDSEIRLTTPLQSAGYVELTLRALQQSGISVEQTAQCYRIPGGQTYQPGEKTVEGDYSNAAFWLCAGAIGKSIKVDRLDSRSVQGDRAITALLRLFGASVQEENGSCTSAPGRLAGCRIDAGPIPDLVPILAVTAAFAHGDTEIYNAARLRIKESDRLATVTAMLRALGGQVDEFPDRLVIHGGTLRGGAVDGANDHRIVMSAAIAGAFCKQPVTIRGYEAVNKSYPNFFEDYQMLGGSYHVI